MGRGREQETPTQTPIVAAPIGQSLRQVQAVGVSGDSQGGVCADQESHVAPPGDRGQPPGLCDSVGGAERPEDNSRSARHPAQDEVRGRRSHRIGKEQQGGEALPRVAPSA